jgi:hypothetical protein
LHFKKETSTKNINVAKRLIEEKKRKCEPNFSNDNNNDLSDISFSVDNTHKSTFSNEKKTSKSVQSFIQFKPNKLVASVDDVIMDTAIADFIHSKGLPFSLTEDVKFKNMIKKARYASLDYEPPKRKAISGELLTALYKDYVKTCHNKLLLNVMYYGLSLIGDGATIKKMPLFNILVSGQECQIYVARVYDCTEDLQVGQNKSGEFLANLFRETAMKIDPDGLYFDLFLVDGASNCQLAGTLLQELYPRITIMHGCEHILSLFCSDLLNKTKIKTLVQVYKIIYKVFGTGSTHMAYAHFKNYAALQNNNKKIGLIRASETRMGGYFYAFHRLLRLRRALKKAIQDDVWHKDVVLKKKGLKEAVEKIIENDQYFEMVKAVVIILYPVIIALRFSDRKQPGMDKIYYLTRQVTDRIKRLAK